MPSPHASLLDYYLGQMYQAQILGGPPSGLVLRQFREGLDADAGLRTEAERRLATFTENLLKRDFISKIHRDCLRRALAMETV